MTELYMCTECDNLCVCMKSQLDRTECPEKDFHPLEEEGGRFVTPDSQSVLCGRCGKEIEYTDGRRYITDALLFTADYTDGELRLRRGWHDGMFCADCTDSFRKWMRDGSKWMYGRDEE